MRIVSVYHDALRPYYAVVCIVEFRDGKMIRDVYYHPHSKASVTRFATLFSNLAEQTGRSVSIRPFISYGCVGFVARIIES